MKEADIRPAELFNRYLELCVQDADTYFSASVRQTFPCLACGGGETEITFTKHGFDYTLCRSCGTLYQSPRPAPEDFARFYRDSPSAHYWAQTFFPSVAEARLERLIKPKVQEVARLCNGEGLNSSTLADVGAGSGLFLEEWGRTFPDAKLIAIEPNPLHARECRQKEFKVLEAFVEEVDGVSGKADLVTAFEVIEHAYDPLAFCAGAVGMLRPGGRLLLTGLTVDGFDIQVLWEHSKSVSPPHHLNFLSVQGFERLLTRAGLTEIKIFTPGKLDVDIVKNAWLENPSVIGGQRFIRKLLDQDESTLMAFQEFLQQHCLSSHCWAWAMKPL